MVWPCDEKRRNTCSKDSNNDEGGREETSSKAQTEVDGQRGWSDLRQHQLDPELAQNRDGWRKAIMAIDPGQG